MSDLPAPPSSSPTSSNAAARPHAELAFLVHSPNTFSKDLPPDVDNRPLARQKRRRTSKEDEEILKAEYQKNPKPDKAARIEIVSKVALGEKEVQNDRRRSRPFDSSSSVVLSSEGSNMSDPVTDDDVKPSKLESEDEHIANTQASEDLAKSLEVEGGVESQKASDETAAGKDHATENNATTTESQSTIESIAVDPSTDANTIDTAPTELNASQQSLPSSQGPANARSSWISNRRSASFRYSEDYAPETITFPNNNSTTTATTNNGPPESPETEQSTTTRSLKRAHSYVRLSMTDEGTARVITDADKTPSPPHPKTNPSTFARAAAGLRRSYSAAGLNDRLVAASRGDERTPKIPRTASNIGRSRDSRAWEFWCDPDTRNSRSLTTRADQEGSGSAADAIGLLRANRKILAQNPARQNSSILSSKHGNENSSGVKKNRSLQRASTTHGRLQSKTPSSIPLSNLKPKPKHDRASLSLSDTSSDDLPQTESDKENWDPDDIPNLNQYPNKKINQNNNKPIPANSQQRQRQILGENTEIMSQSSSLGAMLAREKENSTTGSRRKSLIGKRRHDGDGEEEEEEEESEDPEQDEELRMFMKGGSAEEAGCVEGLLKLSQANWR